MSLTSVIVEREIATIREVEEALARQVLYGGDIVTNLLEVSRLDEYALMSTIAETVGVPPAPPGELPRPSADAKRLVAAEVALERAIAPISVDEQGLMVAVAQPLAREVEQELTFALALPLVQRVAPLVRIRQALARDYGIPLDRRLQRLLSQIVSGGPRRPSSFPELRAPAVKAPPSPPSKAPPPPPAVKPPPRDSKAPKTLVRSAAPPPARPGPRRRGPLTFDVAAAEFEDAVERDTIFDLVFEFARQYFDYTALFIVQGEVAMGRDAFGDGAPRDKVARIGVPLDLPNLLTQARNDKGTVRAVPKKDGIDPVLMADLARSGTTECAVIPIVVRARVVALVFGDGGMTGIDIGGLTDVQKVVAHGVAAFERIIVRRKLQGASQPPRAEAAGRSSRPPPHTKVSEGRPPAAEELAAPIRDLMSEPASIVTATTREPPAIIVPPAPPAPVVSLSGVDAPPPANILQVRRHSGPPIPREEPEPQVQASRPPMTRKSSSAMRRAEAPPLDFASRPPSSLLSGDGPAGPEEAQLLEQIQGRPPPLPPAARRKSSRPPPLPPAAAQPAILPAPPPAQSPLAQTPREMPAVTHSKTDLSPPFLPAPTAEADRTPHAPNVFDLTATPTAPPVADTHEAAPAQPAVVSSKLPTRTLSSKGMPQSEQQISVAPHRPPSARTNDQSGLPSVIVDVASEWVALVQRVIERNDEEAEAELLRAGGQAMPTIMASFPGPILVEEARLVSGPLPRPAECGPVLRLIASQRRTALPFVLAHVEDPDIEKRFWATYLLTELVYPEAIDLVVKRALDEDPRVRAAGRLAARALAEAKPGAVVERLAAIARDRNEPLGRSVLAIEALEETREPLAVPVLLPLLMDPDDTVARATRAALATVSRQDFGPDPRNWHAWWGYNKERHRIEWLIDSLMHDQRSIRAAASEELKTLTKEYFGYYDDLPKRERERAQARFREWWSTAGRARFAARRRTETGLAAT